MTIAAALMFFVFSINKGGENKMKVRKEVGCEMLMLATAMSSTFP